MLTPESPDECGALRTPGVGEKSVEGPYGTSFPPGPIARLLGVRRGEKWGQGIGGLISRVTKIGKIEGGLDRLQQRVMRLEARVLNALHAVVRDGDEDNPIDVVVVCVGRPAAGRKRIAEPVHVAALVGHDVGELWNLPRAKIAEQLLERHLLCELLGVVLDLGDVRKWVVLDRVQLAAVVVPRPIGEMRSRLRNVLQVGAPVFTGLNQLAGKRRQVHAPAMAGGIGRWTVVDSDSPRTE